MPKPVIPDVLAARYASSAMAAVWSPAHKIVAERQLWLAVLRAQAELGIPTPDGAIAAYAAVAEAGVDAGVSPHLGSVHGRYPLLARIKAISVNLEVTVNAYGKPGVAIPGARMQKLCDFVSLNLVL